MDRAGRHCIANAKTALLNASAPICTPICSRSCPLSLPGIVVAAHVLPNVQLYARTNDTYRYDKGYAILRNVVTKRLSYLNLTEAEVFEPNVLDQLILKSGGILRQLIARIRDACGAARIEGKEKIDLAITQAVIDIEAKKWGTRLTSEAVEELRKVRLNRRPSKSDLGSELLHELYIVAYEDPGVWFDAHPLIWDELNER